jgi:hypothetical protein
MKLLLGNPQLLLLRQIEMPRRKRPTSLPLPRRRVLLQQVKLAPRSLEKNLRKKNKLKHMRTGSPAKENLTSRSVKFGNLTNRSGRVRQLC